MNSETTSADPANSASEQVELVDIPETTPDFPTLNYPADGIPAVTDTAARYQVAYAQLLAGTGPLALDTERAQGFRYSAKAYLVQLRRAGSGTVLLDPVAFENGRPRADFAPLAADLADVEWILHAANQDLPCLAEINLLPKLLFDTELAARLLGLPKVNLSTVMEQALGIGLRKEHSAADWSKRPLPKEWLVYAALDVERLSDLRDWLDEELRKAGKRDWATQEFAYLVEHAADLPIPRTDPWRRTSGLHQVRSRLGLAVVRNLWLARDAIAINIDCGAGRILPDRAITELAVIFDSDKPAATPKLLGRVSGFKMRRAQQHQKKWLAAINQALDCPKADLPIRNPATVGPPAPRQWENRWPDSFARWNRVRPALLALSEQVSVPVENLITPDTLRNLLFDSPKTTSAAEIDALLTERGVRMWQRELAVPTIVEHW